MTCRIPDFTQLIEIQCNGSSRGLCSVFFCSPNMIRNGSNAVHFQIPSMSYTTDNCEWSCTHGTTTSSLISFTIYSKNSRKDQIKPWHSLCKMLVSVACFSNTWKFVKKQFQCLNPLLKVFFYYFIPTYKIFVESYLRSIPYLNVIAKRWHEVINTHYSSFIVDDHHIFVVILNILPPYLCFPMLHNFTVWVCRDNIKSTPI